MKKLFAALAIVGGSLIVACGGVSPEVKAADTAIVAVEDDQQKQCVDLYLDAGVDAQNACRATVRATWDRYWTSRFDATVDGGAE